MPHWPRRLKGVSRPWPAAATWKDRRSRAAAFAATHLGHAAGGLGGIHDAVAAIAMALEQRLLRVGTEDARISRG